jgi:hypothetical protein
MTVHDHDNDDTTPENLGPNDGLDPFFEQGPKKSGNKQKQKPSFGQPADADPEDMLFAAPAASDGEEPPLGQPGRQFDEEVRSQWAGRGMSPDEIGIPVENSRSHFDNDDELGIDSEQELELVDDENGLSRNEDSDEIVLEDSEAVAEAADAVAADDDLLGGEVFVLDDGDAVADGEEVEHVDETDTIYASEDADPEQQGNEGNYGDNPEDQEGTTLLAEEPLPADGYPVEEGWEPVEAEADDTGLQTEGEGEVEAQPEEADESEPNYRRQSHFEVLEGGGEDAPAESVVLEMAPYRGRTLRLVGSLAAAMLVLGAAGVVVLSPEWVGLKLDPQLSDRVEVARPDTGPRVPQPAPPKLAPQPVPTPIASPSLPAQPSTEGVLHSEPVVPTPSEPSTTAPVVSEPAPVEPGPQIAASELPRYQPAGETLWIGQFDPLAEPVEQWTDIRPGSKAFAQLQNGNFFIGSVKGVARDALIMTVKQGEVSLPRKEVTKLTALDSTDYFDLQRATTGFLKLSNKNRLVGAILESVVDDQYIIQMRSDRIVVPRSEVEQVVQHPASDNLRFGSLGDEEEWLRQVAARQLKAMRTGKAAEPALPVRSPGAQVPKSLPVKKAERKTPTDR